MDLIKRIMNYVDIKHYIIISGLLSFIHTLLLVSSYFLLYRFFYDMIVNNNISSAYRSAISILFVIILSSIVYFGALWMSHLFAFRLETSLRKKGISNLMKSSFSFFDTHESGVIRKIIDDNATETHTLVAHIIPDFVVATVFPIVMIILSFIVDIRLGVLFVVLFAFGAFQVKSMMGDQTFMKYYMESLEKMSSQSGEYIRGMQVVKIFGGTLKSFRAFYESIVEYGDRAYDYTLSCRIPYVFFQIVMNLIVAISIPFTFIYLSSGENPREILAKVIFFAIFSGLLFGVFMKIMYLGMHFFQAKNSLDKLENLFEDMNKKSLKFGAEKDFSNFDIEFKNVSFGYGEELIIKDLNLRLEEGKSYALVGSSGGGKSTIAKLISGFYDVDEGEISIGGKSLSQYNKDSLVSNISFVFQKSKLFKMSIFDNVKFARDDATYDEVMNALHLAQCDDILDKFPDRENTIIGSKGVYLSGGETQRIAIARAILKNSRIVILDEASAAADPENEYEIQKAFSNLMDGKTVIMIAHRLTSIVNVDEILLIENGNVVERGSHDELMSLEKKYYQLQKKYSIASNWFVQEAII